MQLCFGTYCILQGAFQLFTRIDDSDPRNNQLVDVIFVEKTITPTPRASANFTNDEMYVGNNNHSTIELRFRVVCSEDHYGPNCTTFCTPMDNLQGHFSCDQNGRIVCNPGYTNTMTNCVECVPAEGCCELPYAANSVVPVHAIMAEEYQQYLARLCQLFSQTHSVTIK